MKLNESQFVNLIANMTKQVLKESMGIDPEVGANEYENQQNYFNSPEGDGMPMDDEDLTDGLEFFRSIADEDLNPIDAEKTIDHDDYFAQEEPETTPAQTTPVPGTEEPEFGSQPKFDEEETPEMLQEKQNNLLSFITENWDNHANNLIK